MTTSDVSGTRARPWLWGLAGLGVLVLSVAHFNVARGTYAALPALVPALSETTTGEVTHKRYTTGRSSGRNGQTTYTYFVRYAYQLPGERRMEAEDQVPEAAYDAYQEGEQLPVRYLAAHPTLSLIDGYTAERIGFLGLMTLVLAALDGAALWIFRRVRRRAAP